MATSTDRPATSYQEILRRTRLGLALTLRDLHQHTMTAMQATLVDDAPEVGARLLAFLTKRVTTMQIILDRVRGRSWTEIASQHGGDPESTRRIYAPMERAWRAGSQAPWAPDVPGAQVVGLMPIEPGSAEEADLLPYLWMHRPGPTELPPG